MESVAATDTDQDTLTLAETLADIEASTGKNPDPTGDYATGRTRFFPNTEEFLAYLSSLPSRVD